MKRLFVFCFLAATAAFAQFSSAIQGTVTDSTQGAIPDAKVIVKNQATGVVREAVTNTEGNYRISSLGPGLYTITFQKSGFNAKEETSVPLALSEVGRVDVILTVGAVSEHVDVIGTAVLLETEQGRV